MILRGLDLPRSDDRVPEPDHHVVAPGGEDPDLLPQVKAADPPGQLEDVAVQLVGDVHDDDGALRVPGAGHHGLVVGEVLDPVHSVTVQALHTLS